MKNKNKKAVYIVILLFLFGMIGATFCYFLGKTETFSEALCQFWRFGIALVPLFFLSIWLVVRDVRKMNREDRK